MSARFAYAGGGLALGLCFPTCALTFAYLAGTSSGAAVPDLPAFIVHAHATQALYFLVDLAPLLVTLVGFLAGLRQDATADLAQALRGEASRHGAAADQLAGDLQTRKRLEAKLTYRAFHDSLTNLANRALLSNRIDHALARAGSKKSHVAVLLLDLDDFKAINDSLGHELGDGLLIAAAGRLSAAIRQIDTLARLGGDEFALLIESATLPEAVAVGQRLIDALVPPVTVGERSIRIGASVGVAFGRDGASAQTLLRDADLAMYEAKTRGKDCLRVFRPELHSTLLKRVELSGEFARAIRNSEFEIVYQPIVELTNERIVGMEALIRWNHPQRGRMSPAAFIKIAEETKGIIPLGRWILRTACAQMAQWESMRGDEPPLTVTVNVSPVQLAQADFIEDVRSALLEAALDPAMLVLEITESALIDDTAENLDVFLALKALGVRLAIDDFGTGYSSLSYLQRYPFDVLKIDKSFVDGVATGGSDVAFARTIIALGGMLALRVLAEGIEHRAQFATLKEMGCELGQGYLFAKPLDVAAMTDVLMTAAKLPAGAIAGA